MILYHASPTKKIVKRYYELFGLTLNILVSMAINRRDLPGFLFEYRYMINNILADSGAWSIVKGNSGLTLESVMSVFKMFGSRFSLYFNYDTDFSDKGFDNNIANQIIMERAGLTPVPVVHNFFDSEISYYVRSGKYSWLALGSKQAKRFDDFRYAIDRIKKWGNPDIKIHWFGGSRYEWLIQVPVASCDTTSWAKTGAYGYINYWNDEWDDPYKLNKVYICGPIDEDTDDEDKNRLFRFTQYPWKKQLEEFLYNTFKLTFHDLCGYHDKYLMQLVNIRYFTELERWINEERIKRGVPLE